MHLDESKLALPGSYDGRTTQSIDTRSEILSNRTWFRNAGRRLIALWYTANRRDNLLVLILLIALNLSIGVARAQEAVGSLPDNSPAVLAAIEEATVDAIEKAERSVVAISRFRNDEPISGTMRDLPIPLEPQVSPEDKTYIPQFFGSGIVLDAEGHIVTCAHVLDDPRKHDYFVWIDNERFPAKVVSQRAKVLASDAFSDLAVLKIDATGLTPAVFGDCSRLRKGQFVVALGNPEAIGRDGEASASWGIISNLKRMAPSEGDSLDMESIHQLGTLIQTDAKLNLGTSGGALINMRGEVIGITTALAAINGYEQSAGFAIATDELFLSVIERLKLGRLPEFGFLGIQPEDLSDRDKARGLTGARVSFVIQGLPGDRAGLKSNDIIVAVDGVPVANRTDLFRELSSGAAGKKVTLLVQRQNFGNRITETLVLDAELSKKFVATKRPGYAIHEHIAWRGMEVEYSTAVPQDIAMANVFRRNFGVPHVTVLSVVPDSPAWMAGVRAGYGILTVSGEPVSSPDAFYEAVEQGMDSIEIALTTTDGRTLLKSIPAPVVPNDEAAE